MSNERLGCAFKQNSQPKVTDTGDANTPAALTVKETEEKKKGRKKKKKKSAHRSSRRHTRESSNRSVSNMYVMRGKATLCNQHHCACTHLANTPRGQPPRHTAPESDPSEPFSSVHSSPSRFNSSAHSQVTCRSSPQKKKRKKERRRKKKRKKSIRSRKTMYA